MKLINILVLTTLIFAMISCSKPKQNYTVETINGVKTYKNTTVPNDDKLKITLKELFTIQGIDSTAADSSRNINGFGCYSIDSKNNIYIMDYKNSVKKFDQNGTYIRSFGRRGTGPGESALSWNMLVLNDTVIYDDYNAFRMLKFDTEGNFKGNIKIKTSGMPERYKALGNDKIVGYQGYDETIGKDYYSSYNLTIMDKEFNKIKEIFVKRIKFDEAKYNFFDIFLSAYAISDSLIFFAEKSDFKYKINAYDYAGNLKYAITKNYAKIPFNKAELADFDKKYSKTWYFSNNKSKFKSAISQMEIDKHGRLWVFASVERNEKNQFELYADIFKDGIFLNRVKLDFCNGYDFVNYDHIFSLDNDRLYYINSKENYLKVFEY